MRFILNINKPPNITSHDVVYKVRKITGIKKIGHAGTLDPFATGVLLILIDQATKKQDKLMRQEKEYTGVIKLGECSDTLDKTGNIKKISDTKPSRQQIQKVLKKFIGEIDQIPPMYSAIKIKGQKLYNIARHANEQTKKDIESRLQPRKVLIKSIKLLRYTYPVLTIKITCGSGTYIRSLARDIGKELGTGGYLEELTRTKIGDFGIEDSIELDNLNKDTWENFAIEIT